MTFIVASNPKCPGPGWRKLEIGEIVGETDLRYFNTEWQRPMIYGHPLSESDLVTWRPIDPIDGPCWRDLAADEMLDSTDLYWSSGRKCWLPSAFVGLLAGNELRYRRWVGDQAKTADVITQPGLYEDRTGAVVEVTAEESQSEGKQWVVRGDGSPTYYTSDGRRVSYKGPGSEHDDPHQLMRHVGPPPVIEHIPVSAPAPITVKAGWWRMRGGEEILVFEWKPAPPQPNNPFKWCGMTASADVIFWTEGGYCIFDASAATQDISDEDLLDFLRPLDTDEIVSLNETLQAKHLVIQEMTHQITDLQSELATRRAQAETMRQVIETKARVIERQGSDIEARVATRLADLQQRYNDMVVDRDEWCDKANRLEKIVASNHQTIESLQSQISQLSKKQQSAETQAAMEGIAALRAEIDRLSTEKESIARLALTRQEEKDSLQQQNSDLRSSLQAERDLVGRLQGKLDQKVKYSKTVADELSRLREQFSHPNLSLIATKLGTPDNEQQQQIIISGLMILSQLVRKNMDYRGSAFTPPVLLPQTSPIVAMCCRASDKITRLANLMSGSKRQVESETVLDTIGDLAGYATLLYCYCSTLLGKAELSSLVDGDGSSANCEQQEAAES